MKKILSLCTILSLLASGLDARNNYDDIGYMTFKYGLTSVEDDFSLDQHTFAVDFIPFFLHVSTRFFITFSMFSFISFVTCANSLLSLEA